MLPEPSRRAPTEARSRSAVAGVVIPIRAFAVGKVRLADALDAEHRAELSRHMAERVVAAAGALPVVVVSGAPEVRAWAHDLGIAILDDPGTLDGAALAGVHWCATEGLARAVVAHADLPHVSPGSLGPIAADASRPIAVLVPCHRGDGTPVCSIPVSAVHPRAGGSPFTFAYGPGSFRRHLAAARRAGLASRVVRDPALAFDVDMPEDLASIGGRP